MTQNNPTNGQDISKEQLENAGIDVDSIEDHSKEDLIKLLNNAVDDTSAEQSSKNTSKNKSDQTKSNTKYKTPKGFQLSADKSALIQCESKGLQKEDARKDFLGLNNRTNPNVLLIQYNPIDADTLEDLVNSTNRLHLLTVNYEQNIPDAIKDSITVESIDDPSDITQLGITTTGIIDEWTNIDRKIGVSIDSMDKQLEHKTTEGLFRFLHIFINKLVNREAKPHFFVNPSNTKETKIKTTKSLFDVIVTIDDSGVSIDRKT